MKAKLKYLLATVFVLLAVLTGRYSVDMLAGGEESNATADVGYEESSAQEDVGDEPSDESTDKPSAEGIREDGQYTSKEEVAAYLKEFGHLPDNFISKEEAKELGWDSKEGNLSEVAPGKSIGGDYFGNYEGALPEGKTYHECDINSDGGYRGAERIVYSEDGCIYYTEDHYVTFELLYGEE